MHFLIIGATGRNGNLVVQAALAHGHSVTALVRNPDALASNPNNQHHHPQLTYVKGTPTSQADVQSALVTPRPPQAVISTLGIRRTSDSPFAPLASDAAPDFMSQATKTVIAAATAAINKTNTGPPPPKLIINSSLGVGPSFSAMILPFRLIFRHTPMSIGLRDHERVDGLVRASGLPFVMARPAMLTDGPVQERVRTWPDNGKGIPWMGKVTRESLAEWLVCAAETTEWDGRAPVLTN